MLLFTLSAYLTNNVAHGLPIPLIGNPIEVRLRGEYFDDRSVWNIVWSCFATLFACSWVAVHPNIPSAKDSEVRVFGRRLATMAYMLLAPELVIMWTATQHFSAKKIAAQCQLEGMCQVSFMLRLGCISDLQKKHQKGNGHGHTRSL